ncbi:hypothetical protein [Arthrobacter sp. ov118]|nr:hypothetical protein [Arthrobacter sp. ov118]SFU10959.1 hypothetical protein SAMN04487915_11172 [Arthrobacter sp. ov118]
MAYFDWGAYMTDLLTEVNSKSNTLDLSRGTVQCDVGTVDGPVAL